MNIFQKYSAKYKQQLRDLAIFSSFPKLRKDLHQTRKVGLETLLDYQRLAMLVSAVYYSSKIEGDVIEFGTFRGGSAGVIIQNIESTKTLHVCDSFLGMPDVSIEDNFHKKGDFAETNVDKVNQGLSRLGSNFEIYQGFFDKTIPKLESNSSLKISFAHIDVDLYESVMSCLSFCYPRMTNGGIIILDDYGAPTCIGAKNAVDKFFADKVERVVPLSQPAWGCVVGGGDAFMELISQHNFFIKFPLLRDRIFIRNEYKFYE